MEDNYFAFDLQIMGKGGGGSHDICTCFTICCTCMIKKSLSNVRISKQALLACSNYPASIYGIRTLMVVFLLPCEFTNNGPLVHLLGSSDLILGHVCIFNCNITVLSSRAQRFL